MFIRIGSIQRPMFGTIVRAMNEGPIECTELPNENVKKMWMRCARWEVSGRTEERRKRKRREMERGSEEDEEW